MAMTAYNRSKIMACIRSSRERQWKVFSNEKCIILSFAQSGYFDDEIDRSMHGRITWKGKQWHRPQPTPRRLRFRYHTEADDYWSAARVRKLTMPSAVRLHVRELGLFWIWTCWIPATCFRGRKAEGYEQSHDRHLVRWGRYAVDQLNLIIQWYYLGRYF